MNQTTVKFPVDRLQTSRDILSQKFPVPILRFHRLESVQQ